MRRSLHALATAMAGCGRLNFDEVAANDDLVAWFEMDDDGQTIRDSTENGLDGTCVSGPCPARIAGVFGTAIACDGSSTFVVRSDPRLALDAEFTISLWVARAGGTTPISKPQLAGVGASYELVVGGSDVSFCTDPDPGVGGEDCTKAPIDVGIDYRHYAMWWDGAEKRLHVDGVEVLRQPAVTVFADRELVICADAEGGPGSVTTPLVGAIDEVRVYRRALAAGEIAALAAPNLN